MKRRNMKRKSNTPDNLDTKRKKSKSTLGKDEIKMNLCNKITFEMMLQKISQGKTGENVVSSPLSINLLLNMVVYGLAEGSKGQIELMNALDLRSVDETNCVSFQLMSLMNTSTTESSDSWKQRQKKNTQSTRGPILSMANGVWTDTKCSIKPQFHEIATQIYQADTRSFSFVNNLGQVVKDVNSWAEKQTKGFIKDIVSRAMFTRETVLILANALYFKGAWKLAFKKHMTREKEFYVHYAKLVKVPFMNNTNHYFYGSFDDFQVIRLLYQSGNDQSKELSMYMFLPKDIDGLKNLLGHFNSDPSLIHTKCKALQRIEVCLSMPKFKFSSNFKPSDIMKKMGLKLPEMGELTNMVDTFGKVCMYDVRQKSYIEVNEEGSKAASVTFGRGVRTCASAPKQPPSFVADHPFFFMIKDEITSVTLFTGIVRNPLS